MTTPRFKALETVLQRQPQPITRTHNKLSDYFGLNVFSLDKMKEFLSKESFESVVNAVKVGSKIDLRVANDVAHSMKVWAMERGATHYTHWFQPLTGATAEKHDAFLELNEEGKAFENFDGLSLVQQEPDASFFPSGGLRNTFEARGYTAWDPSSPAFVIGSTLCVPTIFVSYTGEALDYKAPLLNALSAIDKAATGVAQFFDKTVEKVQATLGWEQEFFLLDVALFNARPDLQLTGRTLFGRGSAKNQQLSDNYFGSINERTICFFQDLELEALKLGIPLKTRHNEVAPTQFECAPVFEECNLAVDHNQLLMDLLKKVARRHNFRVLLHEKPYAGINGSAKHNNWSLRTDTGVNLLKPGKNPKQNLQFLSFFICAIKAVHDYADLLRASIVSPENDHRLGANEAPPAIISVFIGSELSKMLDEIEFKIKGGKMTPEEKTEIKLNIGKIPEILLDNTDRNRTSPFAFTGNKFEFRAAGSAINCSSVMIVLNSIVAEVLNQFKDDVDCKIEKGLKKDEAIFEILRKYILQSKKIRFEGDGYSEEWIKEAKKRGLSNVPKSVYALESLIDEKSLKLFDSLNVMKPSELKARYIINIENYQKKVQIEARVLGDIALNHIIPAALKYQNDLIQNVIGIRQVFVGDELLINELTLTAKELTKEISERINKIRHNVQEMIVERKKANLLKDSVKKAFAYSNNVFPFFDPIRYEADKLEQIVDDKIWPLPKYRELLFSRQ